ncbi:MAG: S-methyl-5-thioribose kinase, partial [Bacilli bacterium]
MPYTPLNKTTVINYVRSQENIENVFSSTADLRAKDLADGNVNSVFRVYRAGDPTQSVIVKQSLPYARAVGESFPMPLDRIRIEYEALRLEGQYCDGVVPRIYHYDPDMYALVIEDLREHIVMRFGLMKQVEYPHFAKTLGTFLARTLFYTSDFYLSSREKKDMVCQFVNPALCKVTEDLVFTHPYLDDPGNKYNELIKEDVFAYRQDAALRREIAELKLIFMTDAQALLHGDLHTGSIMLTLDDTKVIDPEFGFFGPMGFDIGALLGNLAISYATQAYYAKDAQTLT